MPGTEGVSTDDVQPSMADGGEAGETKPVSRAPPRPREQRLPTDPSSAVTSLTLSGVALGS